MKDKTSPKKSNPVTGSTQSPASPVSSTTRPEYTVPPEPYPWKRVLLGCTMVFICWGIALYREDKAAADLRIKRARDWVFSQFWNHASSSNAQRLEPMKSEIWKEIRGSVLEIGPGYGESLSMVPGGRSGTRVVSHYVAVEPNSFLHPKLASNAQAAGFIVQYDENTCPGAEQFNKEHEYEKLPVLTIVNGTLDSEFDIPTTVLTNAPYDTVVSSMVLCSVDDVEANLKAIFKLLKPGGKFVFAEHVRHTDDQDATAEGYQRGDIDLAFWRRIQNAISPIWALLFGDCRLDRDTGKLIATMRGWSKVEYKTARQTSNPLTKLTPIVYGVAVKA
ncbi:hypothetical protein IW150_004386 [Coemansia sp. RSA 2607]|nr:hypothetical protein IW150_004386 [Coemansia sp. RSA 2607]